MRPITVRVKIPISQLKYMYTHQYAAMVTSRSISGFLFIYRTTYNMFIISYNIITNSPERKKISQCIIPYKEETLEGSRVQIR